jgi:hypothetical protein
VKQVEELVLRTLVLQFEGRVVEIFGNPNNDVVRLHVALLPEPQVSGPNRKGRSLVTIGSNNSYSIDEDEMQLLRPFLDKISEAVRAAR